MKITRTNLRQLIKEEIKILNEMFEPQNPSIVLKDIKDLLEMQLLNKSLGMPGKENITDAIVDEILSKLGTIYGTNNWSRTSMENTEQLHTIGSSDQREL
jgi:hypothetical protein